MNCDHCGNPLSLTHQRRWPNSTTHMTCATTPLVDGVCAHTKCCCEAHREAKREWVVVEHFESGGYDCEEAWVTHYEIGNVYGPFTEEDAYAKEKKLGINAYITYEIRKITNE